MYSKSTKVADIKIRICHTPTGLWIVLRKRNAATEPSGFMVPWETKQVATASFLGMNLATKWMQSRPTESAKISLPIIAQAITSLLINAGNASPEFIITPSIPDGKILQNERRTFMGEQNFLGFIREHPFQIRYVKLDDGLISILPDYAPWLPSATITKQQFKEWFLTELQIDNKIFESRNDVRKAAKNICYNPECEDRSKPIISSHILQQKGIFSQISEEKKARSVIVELTINGPAIRNKTGLKYSFVETSVGCSYELAFWGFCNACDGKLFSNFEKKKGDFTNLNTQLLLSYRAHLNELYKQEYNVLHWRSVRESSYYPQYKKDSAELRHIGQAAAVHAGYLLKLQLEKYISNQSLPSPFKFLHFTLPKVLVATSVVYAHGPAFSIYKDSMLAFIPGYQQPLNLTPFDIPRSVIFLHLIPEEKHLTVLMGYNEHTTHIREFPVEDVLLLNEKQKFKLISDILIAQVETWCVAPSVHEHWKSCGKDKEILQAITDYLPAEKKAAPININLFDGLV